MINTRLIDELKTGGIVSIRDHLLKLQSNGTKICRTESGDPSFDVPENVKATITKSLIENRTHYTMGSGVTELRQSLFNKVVNINGIHLTDYSNILITNGAMNAIFYIRRL